MNLFYPRGDGNDSFFSDLACERHRANTEIEGVDFKKESVGNFIWERIYINSEEGAKSIGRPKGCYDTLTTPRLDMLDDDQIENAAEEIAKELCVLCDKVMIDPSRILVVGLGNPHLTPDSVGAKTAEMVNATMHIRNFDTGMFRELECSEIAVISPGVTAYTGMEALEVILGICDVIEPDAVIAIDALASSSAMRLGRTVQISNTGIFPGSGIGNSRCSITKRTLGVPVLAIGVPTVMNTQALLSEFSTDRKNLPRLDDMFISPREIDGIVMNSAKVISMGINQAFGIIG